MRLILLFAVLVSGCIADTCQDCVRRCEPFAVAECQPIDYLNVKCVCDVPKRAETSR